MTTEATADADDPIMDATKITTNDWIGVLARWPEAPRGPRWLERIRCTLTGHSPDIRWLWHYPYDHRTLVAEILVTGIPCWRCGNKYTIT